MNKITPEQVVEIKQLEATGLSKLEIAELTGLSRATISRYTEKIRPFRHKESQMHKGLELYKKGWTQAEVAEKLSVSIGCVNKWLKKHNIPIVRTVRPKNKKPLIPKPDKIKKADPARRFIKKVVKDEEPLPVFPTLPAIKSGTRKVKINSKTEVWAKEGETDEQVITRYNKMFNKPFKRAI